MTEIESLIEQAERVQMKYLHRVARLLLFDRMLLRWYRWTLGENFAGMYHRIPIVKSKYLDVDIGS